MSELVEWDRIIIDELSNDSSFSRLDAELLDKARKVYLRVYEWCSQHSQVEICEEFQRLWNDVVEKLARYRLLKSIRIDRVDEQSVDGVIMESARVVLKLFRDIVLRGIRSSDMKILCRVRQRFAKQSLVLEPNSLTILSLREALFLSILGFVEPLMIPEKV